MECDEAVAQRWGMLKGHIGSDQVGRFHAGYSQDSTIVPKR